MPTFYIEVKESRVHRYFIEANSKDEIIHQIELKKEHFKEFLNERPKESYDCNIEIIKLKLKET